LHRPTSGGRGAGPRLTLGTPDPLIRFRLRIVGLRDIVGLRVALVRMIGFEDMARVHMAPVHIAPVRSERAALTHAIGFGSKLANL
jgi:hypothetical protein